MKEYLVPVVISWPASSEEEAEELVLMSLEDENFVADSDRRLDTAYRLLATLIDCGGAAVYVGDKEAADELLTFLRGTKYERESCCG
jgi:hypothetical protein